MTKKIICIVIALILLCPIPIRLKDGGSVEYTAILYKIIKPIEKNENGVKTYKGTIIEVVGFEIFNNAK